MNRKKILSMILCITMILSVFSSTVVFAADEETVIFQNDFESYKEGESPTIKVGDKFLWSDKASSATSTVTVEQTDSTKALCLKNSAEKTGGPRLGKILYRIDGFNQVSVEFRTKTVGTDAYLNFLVREGSSLAISNGQQYPEWTDIKYTIDLLAGKYDCYINGEKKESDKALKAQIESEALFSFGANVKNGACVYYDDVKITTVDKDLNINAVTTGMLGEIPTLEQYIQRFEDSIQGEPESVGVPENATLLLTYTDNNGAIKIPSGTDLTWSKLVTSDYLKAANLNGNECVLAVNPSLISKTARAEKDISLGSDATDLTVIYSVYLVGRASLSFSLASNSVKLINSGEYAKFNTGTANYRSGWNQIKYTVNFKSQTYCLFVNGELIQKDISFEKTNTNYAEVSVTVNITVPNPSSAVALDNTVMYTETPIAYDTMVYGTKGVNWDMVKGSGVCDDYMQNLRSHPRLLVTSWDDIKEKTEVNSTCKRMHDNVMRQADGLINTGNVPYTFANGRNWLEGARNMRDRLAILGYAYGMTGERKYIDKALSEIRNAGTFPDWSNAAPIIPSEAMMGCALAYDWMYNGLTDSEKKEIRDVICNQALWQFIHSYSGKISVEIALGSSNRTLVANSCGVMCALAIYDEMPDVASYVLEKATTHAMQSVEAYGADGGFPEGTMYWEYSTRFAALLMSSLENAVPANYSLPEFVTKYTSRDSMKNTAKYCLYMNSNCTNKFNFGDSAVGLNYSPTMYWFAQRYNEPFYQWYEDNLLSTMNTYNSGNAAVQALIWYDTASESVYDNNPLDCVFNDSDGTTMSMRSSFTDKNALFAAVQGGSNKTGHMFASLGTFVIDANAKRWVTTLGQSNYSGQFSKEVYYQKRTEGQNTILLNPDSTIGQEESALAKFVDFQSDEDEAFSVLDLTSTNQDFQSARRGTFMTKGRRSVVMQDEFACKTPSELYWFAHTEAGISLSDDRKSALLRIGDERMVVNITSAPEGAGFEIMESRPLPTSPVAGDEVYKNYYKLAIHLTNVTGGTIAVEFTPLKPGEATTVNTTPVTPISSWALSGGNEQTVEIINNDSVSLMINSPVALSKGEKTFIDPNDYSVTPTEIDGGVLVPVNFISENFKAKVSWDEATQTVTVDDGIKQIKLSPGSDKMYVNDEERMIDVPAQIVNGRTLIPIRALAEAMGKKVFQDDSGVMVISNFEINYSETALSRTIDFLKTRVLVGGQGMKAFCEGKTDYLLDGNAENINVYYGDSEVVVSENEGVYSFTIGNKTYSIRFMEDVFQGSLSTDSEDVVNRIVLKKASSTEGYPDHHTWMDVECVKMSTGADKYILTGTIDNIINNEIINRWSGNGAGAYLVYDMGAVKKIHSFGLATLKGNERSFTFKLEVSDTGMDGTWMEILHTQTSGTTTLFDIFDLGDVTTRYVKVTGYGDNKGGTYNSWTEVRFWESEAQQNEDKSYWNTYFQNEPNEGNVGETIRFTAIAASSAGKVIPVSGVVFSSNREKVATVSSDGTVTLNSAGTATITATYHNGFKTITSSVDVLCNSIPVPVAVTVTLRANPESSGVLTGEGSYAVGDVVKVSAQAVTGYTFAGWYAGEDVSGMPQTTDTAFTYTIKDSDTALVYTAKYTANENKKLTVMVGNGTVDYRYHNTQGSWNNDSVENPFPKGTYFTVTAKADNPSEFLYWMDTDTYRILTRSPSYSFYLSDDMQLKACYRTTQVSAHYVVFKDMNGRIIWAGDVNDGAAAADPGHGTFTGYEFTGWDKSFGSVKEDLIITAQYQKKSGYQLTVNGGTIESSRESYSYGDFVTVHANGTEEGNYFSGWYEGGTLVSATMDYGFYVLGDTTLTAKYEGNAEITPEPMLNMTMSERTTLANKKQSVQYNNRWAVPEGYSVMEAGLLFTFTDSLSSLLTLEHADNSTIYKRASGLKTSEGTYAYTLTLSTKSVSKNVYAVGYVTYVNSTTGEIVTKYTPLYTSNAN